MINSLCISQIRKEAKIEPSIRPLTNSALVVSLQEKIIEEKRSKESNSIIIPQNATRPGYQGSNHPKLKIWHKKQRTSKKSGKRGNNMERQRES